MIIVTAGGGFDDDSDNISMTAIPLDAPPSLNGPGTHNGFRT